MALFYGCRMYICIVNTRLFVHLLIKSLFNQISGSFHKGALVVNAVCQLHRARLISLLAAVV